MLIFSTKLKTPDNKEVFVPNGNITGGTIVNYSAKDTRRVDMVFGVGYADDIAKVKQIIDEVLSAAARGSFASEVRGVSNLWGGATRPRGLLRVAEIGA